MIVYIRTASNNFLCECVILRMYIRMVSIPYDKNKIEGGGSMPNVVLGIEPGRPVFVRVVERLNHLQQYDGI